MKTSIILLLVLFTLPSFASKSLQVCSPLSTATYFSDVRLELEPSDNGRSTRPLWQSQTIALQWKSSQFSEENSVKMNVKMKLSTVGREDNALIGNFQLGDDYGDVSVILLNNYDEDEILVVFDVATDGPIGTEVHRCSAATR